MKPVLWKTLYKLLIYRQLKFSLSVSLENYNYFEHRIDILSWKCPEKNTADQ